MTAQRHDLQEINLRLLDSLDRLASTYGLPKMQKAGKREVRFGDGKNPALVVYLDGKRRGRWRDFKSDEGGSLIDLIGRETGAGSFGTALREALAFLGISGEAPSEPDPAVIEARRQAAIAADREEARRQQEDLADALRYWREAVPLAGTMAEEYLRGRCLELLPPSGRFHPALPRSRRNPDTTAQPALIWALAGPDRKITGVQRVWLKRDAETGRVIRDGKRLMLGQQLGAAIRLSAPAGHVLGLAEGAETGIAATQLFGIPVWGAATRSNFAELELPTHVTDLVLFGDADEAGMQAAILAGRPVTHPAAKHLAACVARRAEDVRAGRLKRVWLCVPDGDGGRDWNNVQIEERAA